MIGLHNHLMLTAVSWTFEVFRDPVIGPSGHSYERLAILEHLKKGSQFDPITREPLRPSSWSLTSTCG